MGIPRHLASCWSVIDHEIKTTSNLCCVGQQDKSHEAFGGPALHQTEEFLWAQQLTVWQACDRMPSIHDCPYLCTRVETGLLESSETKARTSEARCCRREAWRFAKMGKYACWSCSSQIPCDQSTYMNTNYCPDSELQPHGQHRHKQ